MADHPSIVNVTDDTWASEVEQATVPVLIDFWAPWCGPCQMLTPILEEIANDMGEGVKIAKVNVDEHQQLAAKYGVRSIPMLLFMKGGEVKDQGVGVMPKEAMIQKLNALA